MKAYVVTANLSSVLEEGSLIESTVVDAADISEALCRGASILGVTYDMVVSVTLVSGGYKDE